jgi:hypothetical protein
MLEWSEYIDNAERNAPLDTAEQWTVIIVNLSIAAQIADGAGYGRGYVSVFIFFGVWLSLLALYAMAVGYAQTRSWRAETYKRIADAQSRNEEERIRLVCAKMLREAGLADPLHATRS